MPAKNFLLSKTIWGAVIMALAAIVPIDEAMQAKLVDEIVVFAGLLLTIFGRARAETRITAGKGNK